MDTQERLDLLALDLNGNIVIVENKLDDSGRDVTWQALKYASYGSTLTKDQIRNIYQSYLDSKGNGDQAIDKLVEFYQNIDYADLVLNQRLTQRIIMVAANFRKEVTSTVLWLMNYKVNLQCFKAIVYELNDQHFLSLEQIIPTKDTQDYVISMTNKVAEEFSTEEEVKSRHKIRLAFWAQFLKEIKGKSELFQNSNPTKDHWLVAGGTDFTYVTYQVIITKTDASVQLNFGRVSQAENKILFDALHNHKDKIENTFGEKLIWDRMDDKKSSKLSFYKSGINCFNREEWGFIIDFLISNINNIQKATKPFLSEIKSKMISSPNIIIEPLDEEISST